MDDLSLPLVTLAFPLYKSKRFLDLITANLDTIEYPHLEILISDRHGADDAIEILQERYTDDARMRFFGARDELSWVEHYNFLLREARGTFIKWVPHDDTYAADYIARLVGALEQYPDAVAAVGRQRSLYPGDPEPRPPKPPYFVNAEPWTTRRVFGMVMKRQLYGVMHGVFRRKPLVANNLWIRGTRDTNAADYVWTTALALRGRVVSAPEATYVKRYYAESTHARWKLRTWRHTVAEIPIMKGYLVDSEPQIRRKIRGMALTATWAGIRFGGNVSDMVGLGS